MTTGKLKIATVVLLAAGALGLGAALAPHLLAGPPPAAAQAGPPAGPKAEKNKAPAAHRDKDETTVRGRVLGPDGKPLAGARLLLLGPGDKLADLGASGADGRFVVRVPQGPWERFLVARARGAGIDFVGVGLARSGPVELRLVKDHPVRGRVVNTEGKPVAGVRVRADNVGVYPDNSLDSFLVRWKKRDPWSGLPGGVKSIWQGAGGLFTATTDADGRFTLAGVGAERLVSLRLAGAGIADAEVWVVNRPRFDPGPYNRATRDTWKRFERYGPLGHVWLLYGPEPSVIAEAGKLIRGTVTASDTGKGRPGVEVWLTREGSNLLPLMLMAKTDARGRYEIPGARKAKSYMVEVAADAAAGYMPCQARAADTPGYQPVALDIRIVRGVVVTGRVLDKAGGKPVPGFAMAAPLSDNPFLKQYPEFNSSAWMRTSPTAADGTFRVVTIPGPVLLMGGADSGRLPGGYAESVKYRPPEPDPAYPQYFPKRPGLAAYFGPGGGMSLLQGNYCKVLKIDPGARLVRQDILLEAGTPRVVRFRDAGGRPVAGAVVSGLGREDWHTPIPCAGDSCRAYFFEGDKPRLLIAFVPGRHLAGTLRTLRADGKGPAVVTLGPAGSVKGRLVGADGKPLANVVVDVHYKARAAAEVHNVVHHARQAVTDAAGAFAIDDLIPGLKFQLSFRRGRREFRREPPPGGPEIQVKPGEAQNLGVIGLKLKPEGTE